MKVVIATLASWLNLSFNQNVFNNLNTNSIHLSGLETVFLVKINFNVLFWDDMYGHVRLNKGITLNLIWSINANLSFDIYLMNKWALLAHLSILWWRFVWSSCHFRFAWPLNLVSTFDSWMSRGNLILRVCKSPSRRTIFLHYPLHWCGWWGLWSRRY